MDLEEVAVYRRNLQNYKYYKKCIARQKDRITELETIRLGLHGMAIKEAVVQGSQDEYMKTLKYYRLIDDIEKEKEKLDVLNKKVEEIERDLSLMPQEISRVIKNVYCLRKSTIYKESKKVHMDVSTLKRHINKEIWKIIKK